MSQPKSCTLNTLQRLQPTTKCMRGNTSPYHRVVVICIPQSKRENRRILDCGKTNCCYDKVSLFDSTHSLTTCHRESCKWHLGEEADAKNRERVLSGWKHGYYSDGLFRQPYTDSPEHWPMLGPLSVYVHITDCSSKGLEPIFLQYSHNQGIWYIWFYNTVLILMNFSLEDIYCVWQYYLMVIPPRP